ncbi:hypothetical protein MMC22_010682 [Lobaria immixta]|nr:hypothetical protein [Lobaria immixta]
MGPRLAGVLGNLLSRGGSTSTRDWVTFPGTYHEGFSIGPGAAEACDHAAKDWIFNADLGCPSICGGDAVTVKAMKLDSSVTPAQVESPTTASTQVDPTSTHRPVLNPASLASSQLTGANPRKRRGAPGKSSSKPAKRTKSTEFAVSRLQLAPGLISEEEVMEAFRHTKKQELLTGMFFSIGSLQALTMLHEACRTMNQLPQLPSLSSSNVATTMRALEQTEKVWYIANLLKRYHLVRLVEHQLHILKTLPPQSPDQPFDRPASRTHTEMTRLAHPGLKHQLEKGRKWNQLTLKFGMGVLALVPTSSSDSYSSSQVEKLGSSDLTSDM